MKESTRQILDSVPTGASNATSATVIARLSGWSERLVCETLVALRRSGRVRMTFEFDTGYRRLYWKEGEA